MRNYPAGKFHNDAKPVRKKQLPRWPGSILCTHFCDYIVYQTPFITADNIKRRRRRIRTERSDEVPQLFKVPVMCE